MTNKLDPSVLNRLEAFLRELENGNTFAAALREAYWTSASTFFENHLASDLRALLEERKALRGALQQIADGCATPHWTKRRIGNIAAEALFKLDYAAQPEHSTGEKP